MKPTEEDIIRTWDEYVGCDNEVTKLPTYEEWRVFLKNEFFHRWQKSAILSKIDEFENEMEKAKEYKEKGDECRAFRSHYKAQLALHEAQINGCSIIKYELENYDKIGNKKRKPISYKEWRQKNIRFAFFCMKAKESVGQCG